MDRLRVAVVGAGIVGAAVARALSRHPTRPLVTIVEKEATPAGHQTSHNSGVVHAGLYYQPGSDKARLSRAGTALLRDYCTEHDLPYARVGKVLVAVDDEEVSRLRAIRERAEANRVPGVRWLDQAGLREIEPHAVGRAALHSPTTAIVDFAAVTDAFLADALALGAEVKTGFEVTTVRRGSRTALLTSAGDVVEADRVVMAAGLQADRLAVLAGDTPFPRIVPFRGEFHELDASAANLVRGLIYPVPDPQYPFLGIHLTRTVDGRVLIGPNAVLALAREGYRRRDVDLREIRELLSFKGFRHFARQNARVGAAELLGSLNRHAFIAAARRYVPAISPDLVRRSTSGVRAQAMDADGSLVDDFRFSRVGNVFCIRNAPSPAATASLAIADLVVAELGLT